MTQHTAPGVRRGRRIAFTVVAAVATFLTLFLTIGTVGSLVAAGKGDGERLALMAHLPWLTAGWCLAFASMLRHAERRPAALQQTLAMLVGMLVGGLAVAHENDPVFFVGFGLVAGLLTWLHPDRAAALRPGEGGPSGVLLAASLVCAGPLAVYAVRVADLQQPIEDGGAFYVGVAVTAICAPLLGLVAALRARGFRLPGWTAALMLASLGTGSLVFDDAGSLSTVNAVLALAGAAALGVLVEREARTARARVAEPRVADPVV